ncbi:MAG: hypothetical protein JWN26_6 [Candidatus Saccharibacteria bacterium]|nr:hypothetical protein [Candidatus Saccharibacteria bacterium]
MLGFLLTTVIVIVLVAAVAVFVFSQYKKTLREAKNYERGLKMVSMYIHIPPASDDLEGNGRDERDVTEEIISQAQVMYNIISSTATKGFKSRIYGQRHISLEIVAHGGLVHYYVVVPTVLIDVIRQAVAAAYPSARLQEVDDRNIFNQSGKLSGTIGGEFTLKKNFVYPIATYQESKRDAARALLNALSAASREDGIAIQLLLRPAHDDWTHQSVEAVEKIKKDKTEHKSSHSGGLGAMTGVMGALWKPPGHSEGSPEERQMSSQLSSLEQGTVEAIEDKTRHPGFETLVRVVVSSASVGQAQVLLKNVVAAFSLFDSATNNGFKFALAKNVEELVTAYIFRFFPQGVSHNILNSIELATLFHLPDQSSIPTSQVERQMAKQVDGPTQVMDEGFLLGYNEFRGIKKQIRLSTNDRRRHTYIIGQTGTGKSVALENLAYQDMMDGKGFAFIDPHGDSAERLLGMVPKERVEDVIYFDPADMENPIGLNLFEFESPDQRDFLVQEAISMLYRLYDPGHTGIIGPRFETWFRNAALTVMSDPAGSSFLDTQQVFIDQAFADEKLKHVTIQSVLDFWNKEMAQTSEASKSEMLGWFTSKFGAFLSNDMMRNIIGQSKSGFNMRDIMDNKKILLVNVSKGRMGEMNSQLIGMIFVMKFQAAAMGRANIPEAERQDFALYVDEFQNFATDSFESILSEARKYRLNLVLANQFLTQLTDKIREAIIGNIGTVISGRIGITDAEILVKKFAPTFDAEDLTKLPNYQTIASVMINNVPSAAFSMSLVPPMGTSSPQLIDALKKLSSAKYGRPRAQVEKEIYARLGAGDVAKKAKLEALKKAQEERLNASRPGAVPAPAGGGSSFLDDWLAKRQQITPAAPSQKPSTPSNAPEQPSEAPADDTVTEASVEPQEVVVNAESTNEEKPKDNLHIHHDDTVHEEISVKLR